MVLRKKKYLLSNMGNKGDTKKIVLIASITIFAVLALALLLIFSDNFVGKAIQYETDISKITGVGIYLSQNSIGINEPFKLKIQANSDNKKVRGIDFKISAHSIGTSCSALKNNINPLIGRIISQECDSNDDFLSMSIYDLGKTYSGLIDFAEISFVSGIPTAKDYTLKANYNLYEAVQPYNKIDLLINNPTLIVGSAKSCITNSDCIKEGDVCLDTTTGKFCGPPQKEGSKCLTNDECQSNSCKGNLCVETSCVASDKSKCDTKASCSVVNGQWYNNKCVDFCIDVDKDGYVVEKQGECKPITNQKGYEDCDDTKNDMWELKNGVCARTSCIGVSCAVNEKCFEGSCLKLCTKNLDCPSGFNCDTTGDKVCKETICNKNEDCMSGFECRLGKCKVIKSCTSSNTCPTGQECVLGRCMKKLENGDQCRNNKECKTNYCNEGKCEIKPACKTDSECNVPGELCVGYEIKYCNLPATIGSKCSRNEECDSNFCKNNICEKSECLVTSDCKGGERCENKQCITIGNAKVTSVDLTVEELDPIQQGSKWVFKTRITAINEISQMFDVIIQLFDKDTSGKVLLFSKQPIEKLTKGEKKEVWVSYDKKDVDKTVIVYNDEPKKDTLNVPRLDAKYRIK